MARYLIEATATPQTYAAMVKNPQDRAEAIRAMYARFGWRLESYFFGVGTGKHYSVFECDEPLDATTIEALWIAAWAPGSVTSMTITQVLTSAEMVEALKKAGDMGYRPPS
ncbi:MAG: GYD domain-containing protein [Caldilineaceae bacterium]|nr:GYD domain-containing protein [Caldilineaceae bacterium]